LRTLTLAGLCGMLLWGSTATAAAQASGASLSSAVPAAAKRSFLVNGISPPDLFGAQQARNAAIEALTAGIRVPAGANQHQTNGIASYVESRRSRPTTNGGDVAGYFQALSAAERGNVFGLNALVADTPGLGGQMLQNEFDVNINNSSTSAVGLGVVLNSTVSPHATGFMCRITSSARWNSCYQTDDGASPIGISLGTATTGNHASSQQLRLSSRSHTGKIYGAVLLADPIGSLLLRPGGREGAVAFQNGEGTNNAYVNSEGLRVVTGTASLSPGTGAIISGGGIGVNGDGNFAGTVTATAFSGVGNATITLVAAAAGETARCRASHRCDSVSGTIELTSRSPRPPRFSVTFPQGRSNAANCVVQGWNETATLPASAGIAGSSRTGITIALADASEIAARYLITYLCAGQ
jgi:hypothetical protein